MTDQSLSEFLGQKNGISLSADGRVLSAPYVLEYTYRRSVGPIIGAFLTALRDGQVVGIRGSDGRVLVPPTEYDPVTGESLSELVVVGSEGTVTTWAWVYEPRPKHPLKRAFAWALVKLDGADTSLLHAIDVDGIEQMSTGMRVRIRWASERVGRIQDIACFEPASEKEAQP